jgi:hypothetical protein
MNNFKPFENESQSVTIGNGNGITFENGLKDIIMYGDITFNANTDPAIIEHLLEILTAIKGSLIKKDKLE